MDNIKLQDIGNRYVWLLKSEDSATDADIALVNLLNTIEKAETELPSFLSYEEFRELLYAYVMLREIS